MNRTPSDVTEHDTTASPTTYPPISTMERLMFQDDYATGRNSTQKGSHQPKMSKEKAAMQHHKEQDDFDTLASAVCFSLAEAAPLENATDSLDFAQSTHTGTAKKQEQKTLYPSTDLQLHEQHLTMSGSNLDENPDAMKSTSHVNNNLRLRVNTISPLYPMPNMIQSTNGIQPSHQSLVSNGMMASTSILGVTSGQHQSQPSHQQQQLLTLHHAPSSLPTHQTTISAPTQQTVLALALPQYTSIASQNKVASSAPGRKRPRAPASSTLKATPSPPSSLYLLHQACRLYAQTPSVIDCALKADPKSASRKLPIESDKKRRRPGMYLYPINIALEHNASLSVLQLLARAAPDVLVKPDGPQAAATLAVAITFLEDGKLDSVLRLFIECNPECVATRDCKGNYPLHNACAKMKMLSSTIRRIAQAHPAALQAKNFHGQQPLDIVQRSGGMSCDETVDCLQQMAFDRLEQRSVHLHDDSDED